MNDMSSTCSFLFSYDLDTDSNNTYNVCQTMEGIAQALSLYGMQSVYTPEMFDPIEEFDGNPSRLSVRAVNTSTTLTATPVLEHDAADTPCSSNEEDNAIVTPTLTAAQLFPPLPADSWEHKQDTYKGKRSRPEEDDQEEEQQEVMRSKSCNKKRRVSNTNNKDKECSVCGAQFSRAYNKRTHELTHFKDRVKRFPCNACSKSFDRKHDLQRHVSALHTGKRTFACNLCTTTFSRRADLIKHANCHH
ncbi:hypothetical protein K492DRAFT_177238 [Lichtheimia hyalospora FSU 10163]|nr:hypothetical protein K492DRAFT_177238 [Lichtheimia hyalospora FSU 10163]